MTSKVVPLTSNQSVCTLCPQQRDSNGVRINTDSVEQHVESSKEKKWNLTIKMRCTSTTPKDKENNELCKCGYKNSDHESIASSQPNQEAKSPSNKDIYQYRVPTNAFGEIEFVGFGGNIRKFIRVDVETDMKTMPDLMIKEWGMEKPNLIISVTGGAKNFSMKPDLRDVFQHGLMKTARSTDAWIVTGGTYTGVMKHVGEAVKGFGLISATQKPVVAIGIAPWGVIRNRKDLEKKEGSWPARYHIDKHLNPKESFLDPNHSHFILVDDGTTDKFATEISFRTKLEKEMSKMKSDGGNDNAVSVPIVILVLEGGKGTLKTVHQALMEDTPAVIVKGSGRAADILVYAFNTFLPEVTCKQGEHLKITETQMKWKPEDLHKQMEDLLSRENFCPEKEINENIKLIEDCLDKTHLVHIFEWDSVTGALDIEEAILKVLLKVNNTRMMNQLKQTLGRNMDQNNQESLADDKTQKEGNPADTMPSAIELNVNFEEFCADNGVSLSEFLTIKRLLEFQNNNDNLDDIIIRAVQQNSVNFVKLFLDNGISLKELLTVKKLLQLYEHPSTERLLQLLLNEKVQEKYEPCIKQVTLNEVGQLIQYLLGDYYAPHYILDAKNETQCCKRKESFEEKSANATANNQDESQKPDFDNPEWELFVWSVLTNQKEMAKLFWLHGKDNIAAALVANALLQAMSDQKRDTDFIAPNTTNASEFMDLAIGVLNKCYSTDKKATQDLLIQKLPQCQNKTSCVLIAKNENNKEFLSQPACRYLFDNIWMGKLAQGKITLKLLLCIVIPLLIPLLTKFKEDEDGEPAPADPTSCNSKQKSKQSYWCKSLKRSDRSLQAQETNDSTLETGSYKNGRIGLMRFTSFYQAPVVIFIHHVIFYIVFLGLYSYILVCKIDEYVSVEEGVLIVWVSAIFIQELEQVFTALSTTVPAKIQRYLTDPWNYLDALTICLFAIGMILRRSEVGRIILGVDLITFFLRLLHIFSVHKDLGPKLVMIYRMSRKLAGFAMIWFTFIVAYAVSSYSILYPNTELNLDTFIAIIRRPYWNIYGELMLDEIEGTQDCTNVAELYRNGTYPRCPTVSGKYFVPVLMGLYMLICTILLLNLLIAIFSDTYQEVQKSADMLWCFDRIKLIDEYRNRSCLPPPFMLLMYIFQFIKYIVRKCQCCCGPISSTHGINPFLREFQKRDELRQFENVMANKFHGMMKPAHQEIINCRQEQRSKTGTESDSTNLEQKMANMEKRLHWIVKSLSEHRLGARWSNCEFSDEKFEERKEDENKAAEANHILEGREKFQTQFRNSPYPETKIQRFEVQDDEVLWDVEFPNYKPPTYTSHVVLAKPGWADKVDLYNVPVAERKLQFNAFDSVTNTKRYSYGGRYRVKNGIPLNPMGRTGLQSRGILGRWGPNHYVYSVITRWKYDENNLKMMKDGKPQFEFVAVRRLDTEILALPESILAAGHHPTKHLNIKFSYKALGLVEDDKKQNKEIKKQQKKILKKGQLIHKGYTDDPRNTDNAWLESTAYLYQDKKNVLRHFLITTTVPDLEANWMIASNELTLHGAHSYFLKLAAEKLNASF